MQAKAAQNKKKLIQLMESTEQHNIDLGVYQWLAQGFDKTELVNEFINNEKLSNCTGYDAYQIEIGGICFCAYVSDYFQQVENHPDRDSFFYTFYLTDTFEEYVNNNKVTEYAKYYLRKMLDILESKIIKKENNLL